MTTPRRHLRLLAPLAALLLGACELTPAYEQPETSTPAAWRAEQQAMLPQGAPGSTLLPGDAPGGAWWEDFGSSELDGLMTIARQNNRNLAAALQRIAQARAQIKSASAALYPTLDAGGSAGRNGAWQQPTSESFRGSLQAGYEVDLWGANAAGVSGAEANLAGSQYDYVALDLVLQGDVVTAYLQVLAFDARLAVARRNLEAAQSTLALVELQYATGAVSGLELAQQRQQIASITAQLPLLEGNRRLTENGLALLLGLTPDQLPPIGGQFADLVQPQIAPGLPAALLARRPDVRSSEAALMAANADIGQARAAFYPSLSLTADGGIASAALAAFLKPESLIYSLAASLAAPLFDGGLREANLEISEARKAELVENYRQTALTAYREVEDALIGQQSAMLQEEALRQSAVQAQRAFDLASLQYSAGAIDLLSLLDTQRQLLNAQDSLVQARLSKLASTVDLAKALGGGWDGSLPAGPSS